MITGVVQEVLLRMTRKADPFRAMGTYFPFHLDIKRDFSYLLSSQWRSD